MSSSVFGFADFDQLAGQRYSYTEAGSKQKAHVLPFTPTDKHSIVVLCNGIQQSMTRYALVNQTVTINFDLDPKDVLEIVFMGLHAELSDSAALFDMMDKNDPTKGAALVGYAGGNLKDAMDALSTKANDASKGSIQVGAVLKSTVASDGLLLCNGAVYDRTTFPALFTAIGTRYNTGGETATQFRVPNIAAGVDAVPVYIKAFGSVVETASANLTQLCLEISTVRSQIAAVDFMPTGTVYYFAGSNVPAMSMKANGAAVSRTAYAALFAAIGTLYGAGDGVNTFNLPDARGEFLRALDDGRGVDAGRVGGSSQAMSTQDHSHLTSIGFDGTNFYGWLDGADSPISGSYVQSVTNRTRVLSVKEAGANVRIMQTWGAQQHSGETRPRNIAMLALIKY